MYKYIFNMADSCETSVLQGAQHAPTGVDKLGMPCGCQIGKHVVCQARIPALGKR